MKTTYSTAATAALLASAASAQMGGHPTTYAGASASATGGEYGSNGADASCIGNCFSSLYSTQSGGSWQYSLCSNATALASVNSCIASSSCSDSDKTGMQGPYHGSANPTLTTWPTGTYQTLAQACANMGYTLSASPEATFSATSGGSAYPTSNSAFASLASSFATMTGTQTGPPAFVTSMYNSSHSGWSGGGYGPFGHGGSGSSGWGPWASESTGSWTDGPWTSWWGTSGCPASTWSGWTSGPWGTSAPWTTWTGCTASTTATSVVTTTVSTFGSSEVVTTTAFGIQLAQATSATATGSAASTSSSAAAGERKIVAGAGAGIAGLVAAVLML